MATEARDIDRETVQLALSAARRLADAEDARALSLQARAGGLAGFIGLIVPLAAVVARVLPNAVAVALAVVAFGLLLLAVILVLLVLIPSRGTTISLRAAGRYATRDFLARPPVLIEGHFLRAELRTLTVERARNDAKATHMRLAYVLLVAALVCVAVEGILVALTRG